MSRLGQIRFDLERLLVRCFRSYDTAAFAQALSALGVSRGDVLMVHSSLRANSGYTDRPLDMIGALKEAVGPTGLLVMPSMTYTDSSKAYLQRGEVMKQRLSPSRMGLLSEVFRRGKEVRRSLSPTHPLLAWGAGAEDFVAGHESTDRSFGSESPFQRLLDRGAKVLCIDTVAETITFTHFLEDRNRARLGFALYEPQPLDGTVLAADGRTLVVPTLVLSDESRRRRNEDRLWQRAAREGVTRRRRVGNTTLLTARCADLTRLADAMCAAGEAWFDA